MPPSGNLRDSDEDFAQDAAACQVRAARANHRVPGEHAPDGIGTISPLAGEKRDDAEVDSIVPRSAVPVCPAPFSSRRFPEICPFGATEALAPWSSRSNAGDLNGRFEPSAVFGGRRHIRHLPANDFYRF